MNDKLLKYSMYLEYGPFSEHFYARKLPWLPQCFDQSVPVLDVSLVIRNS